jgi:hypothetical protein
VPQTAAGAPVWRISQCIMSVRLHEQIATKRHDLSGIRTVDPNVGRACERNAAGPAAPAVFTLTHSAPVCCVSHDRRLQTLGSSTRVTHVVEKLPQRKENQVPLRKLLAVCSAAGLLRERVTLPVADPATADWASQLTDGSSCVCGLVIWRRVFSCKGYTECNGMLILDNERGRMRRSGRGQHF